MNHGRANLIPSPYRDRSVEENLKLFELMRVGYFKEGEKCLRLRIDPYNPNPTLREYVIIIYLLIFFQYKYIFIYN